MAIHTLFLYTVTLSPPTISGYRGMEGVWQRAYEINHKDDIRVVARSKIIIDTESAESTPFLIIHA